jgi:hypothetical protein
VIQPVIFLAANVFFFAMLIEPDKAWWFGIILFLAKGCKSFVVALPSGVWHATICTAYVQVYQQN